MSSKCDEKLASAIEFDCANASEAGVKSKGYIMNYDDVDKSEVSIVDNKISALPLVDGARAYPITVPKASPFNGTNNEANVGTFRTRFNKTVAFVILKSGAGVTANIIDKLANGKFVIVLENEDQGTDGDNAFEVYGLEKGLKLSAASRDLYSEDNEGGWAVTMQEQNAPSSGIFLYDTSIKQTRTLLEGMLTAPAAGGGSLITS